MRYLSFIINVINIIKVENDYWGVICYILLFLWFLDPYDFIVEITN